MKHEFRVRASSMGAIMTNDRSRKNMGNRCLDKIEEMLWYNKFGIDDRIWSKYMEKGTLNEEQGIKLAAKVLGWFDVQENAQKVRRMNDWVVGEPDVLTPTLLADIKTSWSGSTYRKTASKTKVPNTDYDWQMQCYMWLCDREEAELVYCLTDIPEHLILKEIRTMTYGAMDRAAVDPKLNDKDMHEIEAKIEAEVRSQSGFDHIPANIRVKRFIIKRDEAKIQAMIDRITECRKVYDEMYEHIKKMNK